MKINWFNSEIYFFTDESVKRQITDSISENLTDSDLEGKVCFLSRPHRKFLDATDKIHWKKRKHKFFLPSWFVFAILWTLYKTITISDCCYGDTLLSFSADPVCICREIFPSSSDPFIAFPLNVFSNFFLS